MTVTGIRYWIMSFLEKKVGEKEMCTISKIFLSILLAVKIFCSLKYVWMVLI